MKITPSDITNKTFKKSIRGYDADEVDEFLDLIVKDYEGLYKDNSALKEKIDALSDQLERFLKMENTIQNTLVLAQDASENAKQAAQREADLIVKTAQDKAKNAIDTSQQKAMMISRDYETIKQDFFKFKASYRNFMTSQLELFNSMEKEMNRNYEMLEKKSSSNNTYNYIEEEYRNKISSFESAKESANKDPFNSSSDDDYIYTGQTDLNRNSNIIYHGLQDVENKADSEKQDMWSNLENMDKGSEKTSNNIYSASKDDSDNISTYKDFQYTNYNNDMDKKVNIKDILPGGNVYPITKLDNLDEDELTNVKDDNDDIKSFEA